VIVDAQNRPKYGRRCPYRSLVSVGDTQRERERERERERVQQATEWLTRACDLKCAEPFKIRSLLYVLVTLAAYKQIGQCSVKVDDCRKVLIRHCTGVPLNVEPDMIACHSSNERTSGK